MENVYSGNVSEKIQAKILNSHDVDIIWDFVRENYGLQGFDIYKFQEAIIECGNPEYMYMFAEKVKEADIGALQNAVIETGSPKFCYYFANYIKGVDIKRLQDAVIASGDVGYAFMFAYTVKGADVYALRDVHTKACKSNTNPLKKRTLEEYGFKFSNLFRERGLTYPLEKQVESEEDLRTKKFTPKLRKIDLEK